MEVVLVAIIAGVLGPAVMALLNGRQQRQTKREDWARQDEVAARVAEATSAVKISTAHQAVAASEASGKLDGLKEDVGQIHDIVNSNSMRTERDAIARELILMRQIEKLHRALGQVPDEELEAEIARGQTRLEELNALLDNPQ